MHAFYVLSLQGLSEQLFLLILWLFLSHVLYVDNNELMSYWCSSLHTLHILVNGKLFSKVKSIACRVDFISVNKVVDISNVFGLCLHTQYNSPPNKWQVLWNWPSDNMDFYSLLLIVFHYYLHTKCVREIAIR